MVMMMEPQEIILEEFNVDETTSEVESNPEKVFAKGYGLSTGLAGQPNIFTLDARSAGFGDFDVVIKGASRATIEYLEEEEALYKIKYFVASPGDYQIEIKYDQFHIPGSPFSAKVLNPQNERNSTLTTASTNSIESVSTSNEISAEEEELAAEKLPVYADVSYPSGRVVRGQIVRRNGKLTVKFPREEIGQYTVTIKSKKTGQVAAGSPYMVNVNAPKYDTTLKASGQGLKRANLRESNCFSISAPQGLNLDDLCIAVLGGSAIKMSVFQNDLKSVDILYDVKTVGSYVFHIHEKGQDISSSPFDVQTHGHKNENTQEVLRTLTITIWHGKDVLGNIATSLTAPTGDNIPHTLHRHGRRLIEAHFLPIMNGDYAFSINFDGRQEYKQTFRIHVQNYPTGKEAFRVSGEGTHLAKVNQPAYIYIDSEFTLSKSFAVEFDGPDKIDIIQSRSKDGQFCVQYTGKIKGKYVVSLKYDGFHVGGSPFHINIIDETLALPSIETKQIEQNSTGCKAYGEGLSKAIAGLSSKFTVDAFNAGSGSLLAGFDGYQGVLTEVVCKHMGNCVYEVEYKIMKTGTYKLNVLWAGSHLDGSPYTVNVTDENNNV